jgi:hypothetical protein
MTGARHEYESRMLLKERLHNTMNDDKKAESTPPISHGPLMRVMKGLCSENFVMRYPWFSLAVVFLATVGGLTVLGLACLSYKEHQSAMTFLALALALTLIFAKEFWLMWQVDKSSRAVDQSLENAQKFLENKLQSTHEPARADEIRADLEDVTQMREMKIEIPEPPIDRPPEGERLKAALRRTLLYISFLTAGLAVILFGLCGLSWAAGAKSFWIGLPIIAGVSMLEGFGRAFWGVKATRIVIAIIGGGGLIAGVIYMQRYVESL